MPTFYEFFAGGGMARAGLGPDWSCLFANDFDHKKANSYTDNWGEDDLWVGDVAKVCLDQLPGLADLAWASFPCQDLSLAGSGAGLQGERSGTFWPFWKHITELNREGRGPTTVVLENVYGAITSHGGRDFSALVTALVEGGYRCGAVVVNAVHFVPQSRPRLFVIGVRDDVCIPEQQYSETPSDIWHPGALRKAQGALPDYVRKQWIWWNLPEPGLRNSDLTDIVEDEPAGVKWHTTAETKRLLGMMSDTNAAKVKAAKISGRRVVGTIYKRTRADGPGGARVQRAEVRFDDVAGCLRTPSGGSSRQTIIVVEGKKVKTRLLSPREAARLMGLSDDYVLPAKYNDAYHLAGDGVAVPVVRFLAKSILEPIVQPGRKHTNRAA
ncbi:DNA cytosine methyltransferase [Shimia thalassica]|uniref:DNA cytosine methyltransferase n=1 Tax=Shimia thalassica TaxID=1715693 RepID=UPI00273304A5|nr:DNA cytosine methyltransferase [Shimia thalassica]MDP2492737.1 DNA cytosine methyltransferase [Shimia thalassica]